MTTTPVSTVPTVIEYLVTAIQAQVAADPQASQILVHFGEPNLNMPNDVIMVGEVRRTTDPETVIGSGGPNWLNEKYDIATLVSSWTGSADDDGASAISLAVNARAWQLQGYIETAVRNDPSLGDLVNVAYPNQTSSPGPEWTLDEKETPTGLRVEITSSIHVDVLN